MYISRSTFLRAAAECCIIVLLVANNNQNPLPTSDLLGRSEYRNRTTLAELPSLPSIIDNYNNENLPISRFGMKISRFIKKATHLYETTLEEQQCVSCMVMKSGFLSSFLCQHLYCINVCN